MWDHDFFLHAYAGGKNNEVYRLFSLFLVRRQKEKGIEKKRIKQQNDVALWTNYGRRMASKFVLAYVNVDTCSQKMLNVKLEK